MILYSWVYRLKNTRSADSVDKYTQIKQTTSRKPLSSRNTVSDAGVFVPFLPSVGIRTLLRLHTDRKLHNVHEKSHCQKPQTAQCCWCNEIVAKRRMLPRVLADWRNGRRKSPGGRRLSAVCQIRTQRHDGNTERDACRKTCRNVNQLQWITSTWSRLQQRFSTAQIQM